jgi:hypothetical protein
MLKHREIRSLILRILNRTEEGHFSAIMPRDLSDLLVIG